MRTILLFRIISMSDFLYPCSISCKCLVNSNCLNIPFLDYNGLSGSDNINFVQSYITDIHEIFEENPPELDHHLGRQFEICNVNFIATYGMTLHWNSMRKMTFFPLLFISFQILLTPPDEGPRVKGQRIKLQDIVDGHYKPHRTNGTWINCK